jgi:hypothetical protein
MKILSLRTEKSLDSVKLVASIESDHLAHCDLWFSTPEKYADGLCNTRMDAFLVGLLYPAMRYGESIHVEGCVSKKLLFNINNYVIPLLLSFSPSAKRIKVTANETTSEKFECNDVGTGFSGGIDSFCTVYDHYEKEFDSERRINTFLFLNVGSHGTEDLNAATSKFHKRFQYLNEFPAEIDLDFIQVDSNLHQFHPWGHQKTHTLTSAAGILLMQKRLSLYYYASAGLDYKQLIDNASNYREIDIGAYSDPMILPLLSTESLELISDGMQYTRTSKLLNIINYEPIYRYLNVCVTGDDTHNNCSVCPKCCRTLWTLDLAGRIDDFSALFDIEKYRAIEQIFISHQILNQDKDPFARANIEFANTKGIKLPGKLKSFLIYRATNIAKTLLPQSIINKAKEIRAKDKKKMSAIKE